MSELVSQVATLIDQMDEKELRVTGQLVNNRYKYFLNNNAAAVKAVIGNDSEVVWEGKHGQRQEGKVVKVNRTTATCVTPTGARWRVALSLLKLKE